MAAACDDDDIVSDRERRPLAPKCFAHAPLDTIAYDSLADLLTGRDADPSQSTTIRSSVEYEVVGRSSLAVSLNNKELSPRSQPK